MSVYPLGHVLTQTPLLLRYLDSLALDADCVACASGAFKDIEVAAALPDSCKHYSLKCVAEHFLIGAASSGTVLVFPAGHARHMWCTTCSLGPQIMASHVVSLPDASCSPRLIFPAGHAVHEC